jgi:phospholipase C
VGNALASARNLYVLGIAEGQTDINTAYTATYLAPCHMVQSGLECFVDEKANDGGTVENVTLLQPTTTAGMVNTYAVNLETTTGSTAVLSTVATCAPVTGVYQPAHLFVAMETRANDGSNDQWVRAKCLF